MRALVAGWCASMRSLVDSVLAVLWYRALVVTTFRPHLRFEHLDDIDSDGDSSSDPEDIEWTGSTDGVADGGAWDFGPALGPRAKKDGSSAHRGQERRKVAT
eukprot:6914849-Prymnesium_polylepis.1